MPEPLGGRIPDEIVLMREEAARVLLALDEAVEAVGDAKLRCQLEQGAQIMVEKFLPDLPDL